MSDQPATDWEHTGLLVELHKTQGKGNFRWSFAWRTVYRADKRWFYGETPGQAVQRGHDRWANEHEANQG